MYGNACVVCHRPGECMQAHLSGLVTLKQLSVRLMERIRKNYCCIIGVNSALILLGVGGVIQPTFSALIHNISTLAISLNGMKNLLDSESA